MDLLEALEVRERGLELVVREGDPPRVEAGLVRERLGGEVAVDGGHRRSGLRVVLVHRAAGGDQRRLERGRTIAGGGELQLFLGRGDVLLREQRHRARERDLPPLCRALAELLALDPRELVEAVVRPARLFERLRAREPLVERERLRLEREQANLGGIRARVQRKAHEQVVVRLRLALRVAERPAEPSPEREQLGRVERAGDERVRLRDLAEPLERLGEAAAGLAREQRRPALRERELLGRRGVVARVEQRGAEVVRAVRLEPRGTGAGAKQRLGPSEISLREGEEPGEQVQRVEVRAALLRARDELALGDRPHRRPLELDRLEQLVGLRVNRIRAERQREEEQRGESSHRCALTAKVPWPTARPGTPPRNLLCAERA